MRIALIGSRQLEQKQEYFKDIKLCYNVCMRLAQLGITFTSGLCEIGMDGIAQKAYSKAVDLGLAKESQIEVNTELDFNGDFIDKRVAFGYAIFVLERIRVEKVSAKIEEVANKGFDDMYQLGQLSALSQPRSQASKYFNSENGNY